MALRMMGAIASAMMLFFAAQPAAAQADFASVETGKITGAAIEQDDITHPDDLLKSPSGDYYAKDGARTVRAARSCRLDAAMAQRVAEVLKHARRSPKQWKGLGGDAVIRFEGPGAPLIAVLSGYDADDDGATEMRIFLAGKAAFLAPEDQAVVGQALADAGCAFYRPPPGH